MPGTPGKKGSGQLSNEYLNDADEIMNTILSLMALAVVTAFFQGLLYMIGLPPAIPKAVVLVFTGFSFLLTVTYFKIPRSVFLTIVVFLLLCFSYVVLVSHALNGSVFKESLSFYHYTFVGCLALFVFSVLPVNEVALSRMLRLFEFLVLFQIVFIAYKFVLYGISENIIGTISYRGGALYTVFPLVGISYFLSKYFFSQKRHRYLLFCIGLIFMAFVGGKRAIYFFLPVVLVFFFILKNFLDNTLFTFRGKGRAILLLIGMVFFIVYIGAKVTPTLNPERSNWGTFDIRHIANYIKWYNYRPNHQYVRGRIAGLRQSYKYIADSKKAVFLFGCGPDQLINYKSRDGTERKFGINNSGGITGLATYFISVGVGGGGLILLLYLATGYHAYRSVGNFVDGKYGAITYCKVFTICATFVFILDFIFYTRAFVQTHALNLMFFSLAGICTNKSFKKLDHCKCLMPPKEILRFENSVCL